MKQPAILSLLLLSTLLNGCGILFSTDDENILDVANNLLESQKNEYGEPVKVNMPLRVNYSIHKKPVINQELEIELEFLPERDIPLLRLGMTASEGLNIEDGELADQFTDIKARQVFKRYVTVVPTEENEFYLNLYVVTEIGEDKRAQRISIPVALGEYSLKKVTNKPGN